MMSPALDRVVEYAARFIPAVQASLGGSEEASEVIDLTELIEWLSKEPPQEACSARALLVHHLKTYGLEQSDRRAVIDLIEWGDRQTLMERPAVDLVEVLEAVKNRHGPTIDVQAIVYPPNVRQWRRWLR